MSEFECSKGHLMRPSDGMFCSICGSRVARMDGYSNRQLEAMDREYDRGREEEQLDEDRCIDSETEEEDYE